MATAYYDTVNGRLRGQVTSGVGTGYLTDALGSVTADAQLKLTLWRRFYNEERPHSSLGYLAPASYAQTLNHATMPEGTLHL